MAQGKIFNVLTHIAPPAFLPVTKRHVEPQAYRLFVDISLSRFDAQTCPVCSMCASYDALDTCFAQDLEKRVVEAPPYG